MVLRKPIVLSHRRKRPPREQAPGRLPVVGLRHSVAVLITYRCDVVIPFSERYLCWLPYCVESTLNQNGAEVIVHRVADGCDPSPVQRIYGDLENVRIEHHIQNVGPYVSLNRIFERLETPFTRTKSENTCARWASR